MRTSNTGLNKRTAYFDKRATIRTALRAVSVDNPSTPGKKSRRNGAAAIVTWKPPTGLAYDMRVQKSTVPLQVDITRKSLAGHHNVYLYSIFIGRHGSLAADSEEHYASNPPAS